MSLSVRKLNGDTTFLLTFGNAGGLNVLVDPWLRGQSCWLHPSFQSSERTIVPVVETLEAIADQVDLIIISQDKPDHCHKETLCSWPKSIPVRILATPAAARKIRDWKHFPADSIKELRPYSESDETSLYRYVTRTGPGEYITIANLSSKKDLTGLHNAIGITFRTGVGKVRNDSSLDYREVQPLDDVSIKDSQSSAKSTKHTLRSRLRSYRSLRHLRAEHERLVATAPPLPRKTATCLSCIYSPHGIPSSLLQPYLEHHLRPMGALPVSVLIHSLVQERNPWYMGGTVATGTPGGVALIKALDGQVKTWISAHDEPKDNRGISVRLLRTKRFGEAEVAQVLDSYGYQSVKVHWPEPGETVLLPG